MISLQAYRVTGRTDCLNLRRSCTGLGSAYESAELQATAISTTTTTTITIIIIIITHHTPLLQNLSKFVDNVSSYFADETDRQTDRQTRKGKNMIILGGGNKVRLKRLSTITKRVLKSVRNEGERGGSSPTLTVAITTLIIDL